MRLAGDGTAEVPGELTIKGITQPVVARGTFVAPVQDIYGGLRCALDLTTTIDRRAFGLTWQAQLPNGGDVVSWDVEVTVHLELVQDVAMQILGLSGSLRAGSHNAALQPHCSAS